jgi:hypothetical protein
MMTAEALLDALALPAQTRVDTRIPKTVLTERGAPTAADKRAIATGIEHLHWVAALRPSNTAIPVHEDTERSYQELHVLRLHLRADAKAPRLIELVHRAIPYPILLITTIDGTAQVQCSLAHQRRSQAADAATVLDGAVQTLILGEADAAHRDAWRAQLPLAQQPHASLLGVYQGWLDACTALAVARITGTCAVPDGPTARHQRRAALDAYHRLKTDEARLRAQAAKERQMTRKVELTLACQRLQAELQAARAQLASSLSHDS